MTATLAPSPWLAPPASRIDAAWRFGRELKGPAPRGFQWILPRNCSITPRQILKVYLSLCAVSLVIAWGFWLAGAPVVLVFAGLELVVVGMALALYARHAADRETITLSGRELAVEHRFGSNVDASLVEVSGEGRSAQVGRYLRPEWRAQLAREIRVALRRQG
jgi:uncharacterized membrane protein